MRIIEINPETLKIIFFVGLTMVTEFLFVVIRMWGWKKSISYMYYVIGEKDFFRVILFAMVIPGVLINQTILSTITGISVIIIGLAPDYDKKNAQSFWHMLGSIMGVVSAGLSIGIDFGQWWLMGAFFAFVALIYPRIFKMRNYIFWIEALCYYLLMYLTYGNIMI